MYALHSWRSVTLLLLLVLPGVVQAQFSFTTNNGSITITGYTGTNGTVTIPDTTNGYPVTSIGAWAFFECNSLTNVTILDSVTNIDESAFLDCLRLMTLTVDTNNPDYSSVVGVLFDKSQTTLLHYPEYHVGTSYTIPNSVTSIGDSAFEDCSSLTSVTIPDSVTNIVEWAFYGCSGLTSVTIPNSVTSVGEWAFDLCSSLTSIKIGTNVTSLGYYAFADCTNLTSVNVPSSVTSIGYGPFVDCTRLAAITVDTNNPDYSSVAGVLFDKSQTTLIQYPAGKAGASYTIPNSVTSIGVATFGDCNSLTSVTIPSSVTNLAEWAFEHCSSLTSVYFQGDAPTADSTVFDSDANATAYYLAGTTGWGPTFAGLPAVLWIPTYELGTTALLVGPGAGSDSVVLAVNPNKGAWTAMTNAPWLHLSPANQSGTGNTNVIFNYDANPGATRSGTLTIGDQTLTVTQAGSTYVAANPVTPLVSSGLNEPTGVAVDGAGNVYIADTGNNAFEEWSVANSNVTTLVSSGLNGPTGVAVDGSGNVYIADTGNNAIKQWTAANSNVTTLVSTGLNGPTGVAVDEAGNVYIADTGNNAIEEWTAANTNVTTLVSSGLNGPTGVAVDGSGNVYIADTGNSAIKEWTAANGTATALVTSELSHPYGLAVDGTGNIYIADSFNAAIKELPKAFVDPTSRVEETAYAGSDVLPVVLPATADLTGPFAPVSDSSWLTISDATNGVVSFAFTATSTNRMAHISLLGQTIAVTQIIPPPSLGTTNLLEGPTAGSDSVVLADPAPWTATTNAPWLHLSAANQSGTGSTNLVFSFDANPGATRTGTLTIAGLTLTITQAGSTYVAANPVTTLVSSGLNNPYGVAVDGAGNAYIADTFNNAIKEWTVANNTVTTLVSVGLAHPWGVAVDGAGNVYIADTGNNAIKRWTAANSNVTTLVSSGLNGPTGVAVDGAGNVYIADNDNGAIKEWTAANGTVTTLVSTGLDGPMGVAVDGAGNVYIADYDDSAIKMWTAAYNTVTTLVGSGLSRPTSVAVDVAGNVYIADSGHKAIKLWTAANNNVTTLVSSNLNTPQGVAVDGARNVYIADHGNNTIKELPYAFVDPTGKLEGLAAGSDALVVLPSTVNLLGPFAPTSSDPRWLTISGITDGVVSFAFTAAAANRTAYITLPLLVGQSIPVTQGGPSYSLGTTALLVGPAAGSNSVALAVTPQTADWTATTNVPWLHLSPANQGGTGSTNVVFSYDANSGATRTGTLTIAGQTLTITQAGSTYVAANPLTALVSSGLSGPYGVAVDGSGNVYIADTGNNAIKEWTATNNTVTDLVSVGLNRPAGVAVDGAGNVYISDTFNNAIKKWTAANNTVTTLVSSGLGEPGGVAVDGAGNVYIADSLNSAIKEWTAANSNVTTLVSSGLSYPTSVAVDGAGNVYIADINLKTIKKWTAANNTVTTMVSSGLSYPYGVAVDGSGNVYIANNIGNYKIYQWTAANNTVTTLVSSGLNGPFDVAVDGAGNVYIADFQGIKELPKAFVDPAAKLETAAAGSDVLPVVLPATANLTGPFAPASDSSWLTISSINNGVVSFAFTATTATRTAHISLLGKTIAVAQIIPSLGTRNLLEGPTAGSDSVVLAVASPTAAWTATTNAPWLHLSAANQSGVGSTNVVFSFDANPGATRTGTLTIAGLTLTITQAGSSYVAANPVTTLVSSGLYNPYGVAVDGAGNVYIADTSNNAIKEWTAANSNITTLVSSGLANPRGVAVDAAGNVCIADSNNSAIKEWTAANSNVTTLVSVGVSYPYDVAVDGAGNVYIADTSDSAIRKWTAANNTLTALVTSGLSYPNGVTADGAGNVYIADSANQAIKELPHAFVDPTPKLESLAAASDVLPVVLPATANLTGPFTPASDSSWLTISNVNNGVVSFGFTATTTNRTAHITLLGQNIAITQTATVTPLILTGGTILANGAFQFSFTNNQGASFTVLTTTNLASPMSNWTVVGTPTNNGSGLFQFTAPMSTNAPQLYYRVRSP